MRKILDEWSVLVYRSLVLILFLSITTLLTAQMSNGDYPYCIIDSVKFELNKLNVDAYNKPNNFVSSKESGYKSSILRSIFDNVNQINISDSLMLNLTLNRRNKKTEWLISRMNEIHKETNERAYLAGYSNSSEDTIYFPVQDKSLVAIIEAIDADNNWNPIQFWPISGCGNSYLTEYLLPGETILFTVNNNYGDVKTKMRVRLHGNDTVYVSNEFVGSVSQQCFDRSQNSPQNFRYILCDTIFYLEQPLFRNLDKIIEEEIELEFDTLESDE